MSKNPTLSISQARLRSVRLAAREHARLGIGLTKPVPIFGIIQQNSLWLIFQPLDRLYGAYLDENSSAGIIINSKHPPNLQRFTAAHEYGHYVLKHGTRLDNVDTIQPTKQLRNQQEMEAQTFAAYFLMPLQLVNLCLRQMGISIPPRQITSEQAYRLSLELGTSYAATVSHLVTLRHIGQTQANMLLRKAPKGIKLEIGRGIPPQNAWADVWSLNLSDSGRQIQVHISDELHLCLPESPSTGHAWTIVDPPGTASDLLVLLSNEFEASLLPGESYHHFVFKILAEGTCRLHLSLSSDGQPQVQPANTFLLDILVTGQPTGQSVFGLSELQKPLLNL